MRKLLLMMVAGAFALGANAQQNNQTALPFVTKGQQAKTAEQGPKVVYKDNWEARMTSGASHKSTGAGGDRWYDHFTLVNTYFVANAFDNNSFVFPIWFDSTVLQRYSNGLLPVNYLSVCQVLDPITSQMFNDPSFANEIVVGPGNTYQVDSVMIRAAYVREKSQPANQVDTMILSVIPMDNITYFLTLANYSKISQYTTRDTLWAQAPVNVDSVNRAAFPATNAIGGRAFWKVPLTAADGDTPDNVNNTVTVRSFVFPVEDGNGNAAPLTINKGERFAITATFKSGGTWNANVDSVTGLHRFMPIAAAASQGGVMPYYYYDYTERSMTGLMFSSNFSQYSPSVFIEVFNDNNFSREFVHMAGHVKCADCEVLSVANTGSVITSVKAFPNPANNEVYVPFNLNAKANVNVTLTNTVGQVISTQAFNNANEGKATFNTSSLSNGIYFVTVEANGQRETTRVVVAH